LAKATKHTTPSDIMARAFAPTCNDANAQTVAEILNDLVGRGIFSRRAKILRWVTEQIKLGTMERVMVLRKNSRGVLRAVEAYRVIE